MGARKKNAPRRGSLGYSPRKRASRLVPRVKTWPDPELEKPQLLAFIAYKAGMTHVYRIEDRIGSPLKGREVFTPATIVEAPPVVVLGVRAYAYDANRGLYSIGEAWVEPPSELELQRKISTLGKFDFDKKIKLIEDKINLIKEIRAIIATQPKLTGGLSKKKPDLLEVKIGGVKDINTILDYAKNIMGKQVQIKDVFKPGQLVDIIAVTKGKGFQGPVKRWGVKELPRWHKHRKSSRRIGARSHGRGTWWEIPQAGQMGFHRRTEYNKRILKIGNNGLEITPAGGFLHYGVIKSDYAIIAGSIPGVPKRPIVMRWPIRVPSWFLELAGTNKNIEPEITYISLLSKQGN